MALSNYRPNPSTIDLACHICGASGRDQFIHPVSQPPRGFRSQLAARNSPRITQPTCGACYRSTAAAEGRSLHEPLNAEVVAAYIETQLEAIGLGNEERRAEFRRIPRTTLSQFPPLCLAYLRSGLALPGEAFGLGGVPRAGKTMAVAALLREGLTSSALNLNPFQPLPVETRRVCWLNIPTTVHRWRLDGLADDIKWDIERATSAEILVADDLGRETRRREHAEDAAQGHLDAILTARERENRVTLWTTNSTEPELIDRYGEGMIRRLTRLNPLIWLND